MEKGNTAYCGICCPDCILYRNRYSGLARQLREELERAGMREYAAVESPFGDVALRQYPVFEKVLESLAESSCVRSCREGGGCSGVPCEIMECCLEKRIRRLLGVRRA